MKYSQTSERGDRHVGDVVSGDGGEERAAVAGVAAGEVQHGRGQHERVDRRIAAGAQQSALRRRSGRRPAAHQGAHAPRGRRPHSPRHRRHHQNGGAAVRRVPSFRSDQHPGQKGSFKTTIIFSSDFFVIFCDFL